MSECIYYCGDRDKASEKILNNYINVKNNFFIHSLYSSFIHSNDHIDEVFVKHLLCR